MFPQEIIFVQFNAIFMNCPFKMQLFTMYKEHSTSTCFCFTEISNELIYEIYVWPVEPALI